MGSDLRRANSYCRLSLGFQSLSQCARGRLVDRQISPQHYAINLLRSLLRHEFLQHVPAHAFRVPLPRLPPSAAAAGAHDDLRIRGHRLVAAVHGAELVFSRPPQIISPGFAGPAAPQAPRRTSPAVRPLEVPLSVDEVAHVHIDAETSPELAGAGGVAAQRARFHEHRAFQLDALDRAVAHVPLAYRYGRRFAVLEGPAAPAAAFYALHDETPFRLRVNTEE